MKTKIAFISKKMDIGGIEKAALEILKRLDPNFFEVDYYYRRRGHESAGVLLDEIPSWINKKEITLVNKKNYRQYYESPYERMKFWIEYIWSYIMKNADEGIQYALQSKMNLYEDKQYDLAIAFDGPKAYGLFHTIENINALKKILWIHGDVIKEKANSALIGKYYRSYDRIITVSKEASAILKTVFPDLSNRIQVVYNYVDYLTIRENASQSICSPFEKHCGIKITTVGRLGNDKGMLMAAQCCKLLLEDGINIKWVLCGDGPERSKIEKYINENALQDHFILLGNQNNPYPYIEACDIYVQPSIREGFCTTTNEAKVLCKPVVTTDVCGMREQFVNGVNGQIVEISVKGIYDGISALIKQPALRRKFTKELKKINWDLQTNYNYLMEEFENGHDN